MSAFITPIGAFSVVAASCGYGSSADRNWSRKAASSRASRQDVRENGIEAAAPVYAEGATRQTHKNKDPRGFAEFAKMLGEHSATGHALTMLQVGFHVHSVGVWPAHAACQRVAGAECSRASWRIRQSRADPCSCGVCRVAPSA